MKDADKIMNDNNIFCLNIPIRKVNSLGCESIQDYMMRILLPYYEKNGIKLELVDISSSKIYEIALKKAIEHAKTADTRAEIESNEAKSIRLFRQNFDDGRVSESVEFVRVVKISPDVSSSFKDNPAFKQGDFY